jgi:hypothetical protein
MPAASGYDVALSWVNSIDNVAVAGYLPEARSFSGTGVGSRAT